MTHRTPTAEPLPPQRADLSRRYAAMASVAALAFGIMLPVAPKTAVAAIVLLPLAFTAPVATVWLLTAITVLVPFEVQDTFAVVGGRGAPGLLLIDVLLVLGLARIGWRVIRGRMEIDYPLLAGIAVVALCAAALVWGVVGGADLSEAGHEARRAVLTFGAFLLAWPLMKDAAARGRLVKGLLLIGIALSLWGLAQWMFTVNYSGSGEMGVRQGVDLTSSGRGQLQGGMFAYPVAVILAWTALVSAAVRIEWVRWLLAATALLNGVCLVLTFERTMWVATALGCLFVSVTSGRPARTLTLRWGSLGLAALVVLAVMVPGEARTAVERLFSVSEVSADSSFTYRVIESKAVLGAIGDRPFTGSGFGATVTWEARNTFATMTTPFAHNGYLWLAWKLGVPAALLLVATIGVAIMHRCRAGDTAQWRAVRKGSQAALGALLLICITFPAFNMLGITAAMGLLVAMSFSPPSAVVGSPSEWST